VTIHSIQVSLMSHHRVVVLKDTQSTDERLLPIWIGPYEADAINIVLQGGEVVRPLTHDLLRSLIETLGATVTQIFINDLNENTFYARIYLRLADRELDVDARPSDAIALAVRAKAPIFVAEDVLGRAAITPSPDISAGAQLPEEGKNLDAFRDFVEGLDMDDLGGQ
jgi:uncharacterized protein